MLISCSRDGTVKIWELESGYCSKTLVDVHDGEWVKKCVVSYDGSLIATCSVDKSLRVFDVKKDFREIGKYIGHEHVVEDVQFSNPNSDEVILHHINKKGFNVDDDSESDSDDDEGGAYINGKGKGKELKAPRFIASASRDKVIIIWDIKTEQVMMRLSGHENWVRSMCVHPSGRFLISCADDKSIRCWDLSKLRLYS